MRKPNGQGQMEPHWDHNVPAEDQVKSDNYNQGNQRNKTIITECNDLGRPARVMDGQMDEGDRQVGKGC